MLFLMDIVFSWRCTSSMLFCYEYGLARDVLPLCPFDICLASLEMFFLYALDVIVVAGVDFPPCLSFEALE